jgi:hypothetical protein
MLDGKLIPPKDYGGIAMQGWTQLVESLATLRIMVTAMGLILGIIERGETLKYVGAILGITIALILAPAMLANAWVEMSLSQRGGVAAIGLAMWRWWPRAKTRKRQEK